MSKRKIIAIILFIFLGLVLFTFANPNEKSQNNNENQVEDVTNDETSEDETPIDNPINNNIRNLRNIQNNNQGDVNSDNAPTIKVEPLTVVILKGMTFDVMKGVSVVDDNDLLTATSSILDTSVLNVGKHEIIYTAIDKSNNKTTATRTILVVLPDQDEDNDKFTNLEEFNNNTDLLDKNSFPELGSPAFDEFKAKIFVKQFDEYTDQLPKAHDSLGKELNVTATGDVNTKKVGKYPILYSATDRQGNTVTATRNVKVVDKIPPEITLLGDQEMTLVRKFVIFPLGYKVDFKDPGYVINEDNDYYVYTLIKYRKPYEINEKIVSEVKADVGIYTIYYKVVDASGNRAYAKRIVYVIRTIDEVNDLEITVNKTKFNVCTIEPCKELTIADYEAKAKDWFEGKLFDYKELTDIKITNNADITKIGIYNVTFSIEDWRGKIESVTKKIKIVDKIAPEFKELLEDKINVTVKDTNIQIPKVLFTDNYNKESELNYSYTFKGEYDFKGKIFYFPNTDIYLTTIIYKATDESDNSSTYEYIVPKSNPQSEHNGLFLKNQDGWANKFKKNKYWEE